MSGKNGKRGSRGGGVLPAALSRNERRGEAGFVVYCKCDTFRPLPLEIREREPWRKGTCATCGALQREWRCPVHKLKAEPLEAHGTTAGCPRCGRSPREQRHDQYMTVKARTG